MNWLQLAYQYGVGGLFFALTLWLCFRLGGADMAVASDRNTFRLCLVGFVGYLAMHTGWILLAG